MLREGKGFGFADVILATKPAGFGGLAERFKSVSEAFGFWKTGWLVNRVLRLSSYSALGTFDDRSL
jgi:hypothetical protein